MFLLGNLIIAIATILEIVVIVYYWLLIIRVVISFLPVDRANQLVVLLYNITDPVLELIHQYIPGLRRYSHSMGVDFTPLLAFLALYFIDIFLIESLFDLGRMIAP